MSDAEPIVNMYKDYEVPPEIRSVNWQDECTIAVFDVETTGLNWNDKDFRIAQFTAGIYNIDDDERLYFMNEMINPEVAVPPGGMKVNGLYHAELNSDDVIEAHGEKDVSEFRTFEKKMPKILRFMHEADLWCAYNHTFDVNAFASELKRNGCKPMFKPTIDPMVFERERKSQLYGVKLWDAAKDYGVAKVQKDDLHDAEVDVKLLKDVLREMAGDLPQSTKSLFRQQTGYLREQNKRMN